MIEIGARPSTLDMPLEHLKACHRRIEQRLETLVKASTMPDSPETREAIERAIAFLDSNGVQHTEDEEQSIFPRLRSRLGAAGLDLVSELEVQHDVAEGVFAELKKTPLPNMPVIARHLRELYLAHIRQEEADFLPLAARLLTDADLTAIAAEMRARRRLCGE